jgi:hypothetical protein
MILLDYSGVAIASITSQLVRDKTKNFDEQLGRHIILNNIRTTRNKFKSKFGEIVLCIDDYSSSYWRKDYFPYYKHSRKKKYETGIDWNAIYNILNNVREELREYFPYKIIQVPKCEADDIIGTLSFNAVEPTVIISKDEDFQQLRSKERDIFQYIYTKKAFASSVNVEKALKEKIIRGDVGDGIPNILSPDDTFVTGGRQKKLSNKSVIEWLNKDPKDFCSTPEMLHNYHRNELLIDLSKIPEQYKNNILTAYNDATINNRSKLMNYFIKYKLRNLSEYLGEF